MRRLRLRRPPGRGQALVEFALIFPILILVLFGLVDLGRGVYAFSTVSNAAREGARVAAVNQIVTTPALDCDQSMPIQSLSDPHWSITTCAADAAISLGIPSSTVTVTYQAPPSQPSLVCTAGDLHIGCLADVTVPYTWSPLTPVVSTIWPSITMSGHAQTTIERVFP